MVILSVILTGVYFYAQTKKNISGGNVEDIETLQKFIHQEVITLQLTNKLQQLFLKEEFLHKLQLSNKKFSSCDTVSQEIYANRYGQWTPFQLNCPNKNYLISNNGLVSVQ